MLSHDPDAQIVHVIHSGKEARARRTITYVDNRGILDDLDVRASDLLQANGIVWLEGPSDRLYFNRWITLHTNDKLQEGTHYQCVFYGGRLLAHLSATDPTFDGDAEQAIKIFRVNRNAIVLMDSDKSQPDQEINQTKKRVIEEITEMGGLAWVTNGREVENYIPSSVMSQRFVDLNAKLGQFEDIAEFLNHFRSGEGKKFERNKVLFAETVVPLIKKSDLEETVELKEKIVQASKEIAKWNRIDPTWT